AKIFAPHANLIILATSVAETSITIPNVTVVIDSGLGRFVRYNPHTGLDQLVTERISLAQADQRCGRAGRVQDGICVRLWDQREESGFLSDTPPEICRRDLSKLVLQTIFFGCKTFAQIKDLAFIDLPSGTQYAKACALLQKLKALSGTTCTEKGKTMAQLGMHPRLASLVIEAKKCKALSLATMIVSILEEESTGPTDLRIRVMDAHEFVCKRAAKLYAYMEKKEKDLATLKKEALTQLPLTAQLLCAGWPDFVAKKMSTFQGLWCDYQLPSGHRVRIASTETLAQQEFLVCPAIGGANERILVACPVERTELFNFLADSFSQSTEHVVSNGYVQIKHMQKLDELVLETTHTPCSDAHKAAEILLEVVAKQGLTCLPLSTKIQEWQHRVLFLRRIFGSTWPDVSQLALEKTLSSWLLPILQKNPNLQTIQSDAIERAIKGILTPQLASKLALEAPEFWISMVGVKHKIHYDSDFPWIEGKLQEFFGGKQSPRITSKQLPLILHLTSPAGRILQITQDLDHFFSHIYPEVRAQMRGRYPKHPWPEDPRNFTPTL
ncbi:MAG: hypothetical protein IK079_01650, partial [Desulfovibrio sp.]|nr:hypothetical protein [Desulfovibrio sp.]